jgi:hypothetical protein
MSPLITADDLRGPTRRDLITLCHAPTMLHARGPWDEPNIVLIMIGNRHVFLSFAVDGDEYRKWCHEYETGVAGSTDFIAFKKRLGWDKQAIDALPELTSAHPE